MKRADVLKFLPPFGARRGRVTQVGLARTSDLTAWKGGGFGMFSTLDHGAYRGVDIVVDAPDRSESLEIPPLLETAAARAATCPTDWLLRALAEGVAAREQRISVPVSGHRDRVAGRVRSRNAPRSQRPSGASSTSCLNRAPKQRCARLASTWAAPWTRWTR